VRGLSGREEQLQRFRRRARYGGATTPQEGRGAEEVQRSIENRLSQVYGSRTNIITLINRLHLYPLLQGKTSETKLAELFWGSLDRSIQTDTVQGGFKYGNPEDAQRVVVGVAIGAVCAVLSCYLVLKGWSLMGDAISHAVLPGIVIAYAVGLPLAVGAFLSGLVCAVATGYIKDNSRVKEDTDRAAVQLKQLAANAAVV